MASIFLSHSSQDNEVALDLSRRLKEHGYDSLFLDFDPDSGIKGGHNWEHELYRNLKLAGAVIVLCSPSSMASRWCFVEIAQAKALGKALFPITISPCRVESILNDLQVIDLTALGVDEGCRRLFASLHAAGLDPEDSFHWYSKRPPFPGLNYFDAKDAGIYFGREDEVRRVIETLTRMRRQGEPRLLVVVGSSGSGKSSLIRAGVLPRLGKDQSNWALVDPFRPGAEPISELARSLFLAFPEGSGRPDWKVIRDRLRDESRETNPGHVPAALATSMLSEYAEDLTMLLGRREASMLLVADQAEELLQSVSGDEASAFLNVLRRATERPGGQVFGLLTLRSDFLGSFQNHPALRGIAFADIPLGLLPVENFPQVIEGPADRAQIGLEPGLVRSMIADVRTDDALPLLAFTLREMYERCRNQEGLTLKAYRDLGGIQGAVARVVAGIKTEGKWTPEVGQALRRAFLKLVRLNDEGQFTRQPCRSIDLPDLAAPVLEAFVKARLLGSDGDVVEVSHESLFRVWPELAGWLDEGRELILWRKNLLDEVGQWLGHDRSSLYLLGGARVAEGRRWLASNLDDFPETEAEFIKASIAAEDARIAREKSQQQRLRLLASCLAVAAVAAFLVGIYAFTQWNEAKAQRIVAEQERHEADRRRIEANAKAKAAAEAEAKEKRQRLLAERLTEEAKSLAKAAVDAEAKEKSQRLLAERATDQAKALARVATSRQFAALSLSLRGKGLDKALLLAVEAIRTEDTLEARDSLYQALQERTWIKSFLDSSPDDTLVGAEAVVFSPDGTIIAAGDMNGLELWDALTGRRLSKHWFRDWVGDVQSLAFSRDGKILAAGCREGVRIWDATTRERLLQRPIEVKEKEVQSVAFSPDGKTIAVGCEAGLVLLDTATRRRLLPEPIGMPDGWVRKVAFSPDGKTIAIGCASKLIFWDAVQRGPFLEQPLALSGGRLTSLAFSPDGKTVAVGGELGVVLVDSESRRLVLEKPLEVREGPVQSLAFSPDGKTIAAGYGASSRVVLGMAEGGLVLWDLATRTRWSDDPFPIGEGAVGGLAFSPDGKTIAACFGRGVALLDPMIRNRLVGEPVPIKEGVVKILAYSADGRTIAVGYGGAKNETDFDVNLDDGSLKIKKSLIIKNGVVLLDGGTCKQLPGGPMLLNEGQVMGLAISPDGKTIAAGYEEGVVLWDAGSRRRSVEKPLAVTEGELQTLAFSPDGKILAAGCKEGLVLWDAATWNRLVDCPIPIKEGPIRSIAYSPNGKMIAVGYFKVPHPLAGIELPPEPPKVNLTDPPALLLPSPKRKFLVEPEGPSNGVILLDAETRRRLIPNPLLVKEGELTSVAFSPDGRLVSASYRRDSYVPATLTSKAIKSGGGLILWDALIPSIVLSKTLEMEEGFVVSQAFSRDGKTLSVGYGSKEEGGFFEGDNPTGVILWDAIKRHRLTKEPIPMPMKEGLISSLASSPDGSNIAAGFRVRFARGIFGGEGSGAVVLFDGSFDSWIRRAARLANRNFKSTEWGKYFPDTPYRATFAELPIPTLFAPK